MDTTAGTLFIVATPIGNLEDFSPRAAKTLESVHRILCEDTRRTLKLVSHFGIRTPLESYHEFNEREKAVEIASLLEAGKNIALVSDAGTPSVSDPGFQLTRVCRERGIPIIVIPGPNAAVAALAASGLPSDEFVFLGFLPPRHAARRTKLEALQGERRTMVFYEAPHRILETLDDMLEVLGDREVSISREITKLHEEHLQGTIGGIRGRVNPVGEFTVVVAGAAAEAPVRRELTRDAALKILGISRNQLYDLFFKK